MERSADRINVHIGVFKKMNVKVSSWRNGGAMRRNQQCVIKHRGFQGEQITCAFWFMAPKIIESRAARRHKRIKLNIWGMTCTLKNSQPTKGAMAGAFQAKERKKKEGKIDTHCLSHLGIQPTVIQVLSKHNWRMTHWEYIQQPPDQVRERVCEGLSKRSGNTLQTALHSY